MKRFVCLLLGLSLLLTGCSLFEERIKEPVTFYYLRDSYQEDMGSVIGSEEREASGHTGDLSYLLALYLMGPSDDALVSPVPRGVRFLKVEPGTGSIMLELSVTDDVMTDAEFSLACACLTLTCLDITGAEKVTITSGTREVTMTRETLTLYDESTFTETMEEIQ